jgi:PAS domain S-box-containing protein
MNWITIVWSINTGACLTLAAIYLVVWCRRRESWVYLLFSCSAIAASTIAVIELAMLHTQTVERYEALMRWIHVPMWVLLLSFVAFVRLYLRAGRLWLAWSIYGLRTLVLILNFVLTPNINFRKITSILHVGLWGGEMASLPVGVPNPWGILSSLSLLLIIAFFVDATNTVWRRGDRRRALVIGGSIIFGAIVAWHVPLVILGVIHVPFFLCFAYTGIVAAMGYELSNDMFQAAQLTRKLKESEERLTLAADSANFGIWEWNLSKDEVRVTPSRRELLGFPSSGAIRFENFISRVHAEDRDHVRQAIQNAIEERKVYDSEFRVVLPNGSVRWMTARGTVQVNSSGDPVRLLGVSVDVTARKQAELQTQEQRDELEQLRQQRTASLEREVSERTRLEREVIDICAREQRRIAYDLHDGVGQQLVGIALCAKLLEEQLRGERPSEADKAAMIVKLVNDAARQARLTARTLEGADGVGDLKAALKSLAISVSGSCSVKATVTAEGSSLPISPPMAAQLYRIAQEAVHNAVEHGAAREVQINLAFNHEVMLLTIRDNGKGFDSNANGNGMGLRIMRYRAQCIGGSCDVQSSGEGTVVRCCVPLEPQLAAFGLP